MSRLTWKKQAKKAKDIVKLCIPYTGYELFCFISFFAFWCSLDSDLCIPVLLFSVEISRDQTFKVIK